MLNQAVNKVAKISAPILEEMHISYKICISLNSLRHLNTTIAKGATQMGKFIIIYPKTNESTNHIKIALDKIFIQTINSGYLHSYNFCKLLGDAKLGHYKSLNDCDN